MGIESTFTSDNDGWTIIDHTSATNPLPSAGVKLTDMDPAVSNGSLVIQDIGNDWNWIVSPPKFHQNWSVFTELKIDLTTDDAITIYTLRFFISDGSSTAYFEFPIADTPAGNVLKLTAPLSESAWHFTGDWVQLLANVNAFYVRMNLNNNVAGETHYVDRIALVDGTEPPGLTFSVKFPSEIGSHYQIETSIDLEEWKNVGATVLGNGSEMTVEAPISDAPKRFFRALKLATP